MGFFWSLLGLDMLLFTFIEWKSILPNISFLFHRRKKVMFVIMAENRIITVRFEPIICKISKSYTFIAIHFNEKINK